jgi:hypothetical protein
MTYNKKKVLLLVSFLVIVVLIILIFVYWKREISPSLRPLSQSSSSQFSTNTFTDVSVTSSTTGAQPNSVEGMKIYTNSQYGFEFQYPINWTFQINSFYSPYSKFNLQGDSSAKDYNPFNPAFIINVVTPDFADREFLNLQKTTSQTTVAGRVGVKYEYVYEGVPDITIILPFGQYKMILGATKSYESIFNQTLSTLSFFPASSTLGQ